jgi:hypothetical protein
MGARGLHRARSIHSIPNSEFAMARRIPMPECGNVHPEWRNPYWENDFPG